MRRFQQQSLIRIRLSQAEELHATKTSRRNALAVRSPLEGGDRAVMVLRRETANPRRVPEFQRFPGAAGQGVAIWRCTELLDPRLFLLFADQRAVGRIPPAEETILSARGQPAAF